MADAAVLIVGPGHVELGFDKLAKRFYDAVDGAADLAQLIARIAVDGLRDIAASEPLRSGFDGLERAQHRKEHAAKEIQHQNQHGPDAAKGQVEAHLVVAKPGGQQAVELHCGSIEQGKQGLH